MSRLSPLRAPSRPPRGHSAARAWAPLALLLAGLPLLAGACRSAADHEAAADREVYAIVDKAREDLGASDTLRLERPGDSLRRRLLSAASRQDEVVTEPLTLDDCLRIAAENSRQFQDRRESLYLQALSLTRARWDFSVQQSGVLGGFVDGDGDAARTGEGDGSLGFSKLLKTGARIVGNVGFSISRDLSHGDAWSAISDLSLGVTQPLLRGFGKDIVREPLTQAERDVVYEARSFERFRRTFAFDVASSYYRIVQRIELLKNEEANRDSLVVLRKRNEAFAEAGRLSDIQVDQARQDELRAENRLVEARRDLESALDGFKLTLGLPTEATIQIADQADDPLLARIDQLDLDLDENRVIDVALSLRLDYKTAIDTVADAERRTRVAADALRAGLDLSVNADVASEENAVLDFRGKNLGWTAALNVDLPIDRLPERNAYRSSLIALDGAKRDEEAARDGVIADVRGDKRQLDAARETLTIQSGAVTLAERRVDSAKLNLEAGRASTRDILEAQDALVQAQNARSQSRTDYALAALSLYRDMELLRAEKGGIDVDTTPLEGDDAGAPAPPAGAADEGKP